MPKLNLSNIQRRVGDDYPAPYNIPCNARSGLSLSDAAGLTQFGAHLITLPSGTWCSQRHHHSHEDVVFLVIGGRNPETDHAAYPDIDLDLPANGTPPGFTNARTVHPIKLSRRLRRLR